MEDHLGLVVPLLAGIEPTFLRFFRSEPSTGKIFSHPEVPGERSSSSRFECMALHGRLYKKNALRYRKI